MFDTVVDEAGGDNDGVVVCGDVDGAGLEPKIPVPDWNGDSDSDAPKLSGGAAVVVVVVAICGAGEAVFVTRFTEASNALACSNELVEDNTVVTGASSFFTCAGCAAAVVVIELKLNSNALVPKLPPGAGPSDTDDERDVPLFAAADETVAESSFVLLKSEVGGRPTPLSEPNGDVDTEKVCFVPASVSDCSTINCAVEPSFVAGGSFSSSSSSSFGTDTGAAAVLAIVMFSVVFASVPVTNEKGDDVVVEVGSDRSGSENGL